MNMENAWWRIFLVIICVTFLMEISRGSAVSGPVRFPSNFRCYEGIQNTGMNSSCDNHCRYGIDCMCIKIDNVPGNGTVRGCWANPHSALTPGCMVNNFRGNMLNMCLCDTSLCNGSGKLGHSLTTWLSVAATTVLLTFIT